MMTLRDAAWLVVLTLAGFVFILVDLTVGIEYILHRAVVL